MGGELKGWTAAAPDGAISWGRNVIGAPATALAMLYLSHPGGTAPGADMGLLIATGASALVLLAAGILPLRVLVGAGAGLAGVMALTGAPSDSALSAGGVALGLVFLLCDPVTAPTTKGARLVYGLVGGALLALLAGPTVLRFLPPLVVPEAEMERLVEVLAEVLG